MNQTILEALAAKALEHIDMDAFAQQIAPKLLKEMERGILAEAKNMDWADFVCESLQSVEIQKELARRVMAGLKGDVR